jgi:HPt (histidine-containing phosphotransfer) domain-containing protein
MADEKAGMGASTNPAAESDSAVDETLDRRVIAEFRQANTPGASDFTVMLIAEFIVEAASQMELLRDACQRRDVRALKSAAHSLKGSSMTMGARRLGALCKEMETHADRHPGDAVTSALMMELDREFAKVRDALDAERQGITQV